MASRARHLPADDRSPPPPLIDRLGRGVAPPPVPPPSLAASAEGSAAAADSAAPGPAGGVGSGSKVFRVAGSSDQEGAAREVPSEGCSPSFWAGAGSPVAGAVRSGSPKRYIVTVRAMTWKVVINLESGVSPPKARGPRRRGVSARSQPEICGTPKCPIYTTQQLLLTS